jgi:Flp pilus assembly secretin CpaC
LSAIPILKYIFGSKDHTIQDDDIVFVVVPHIVRSQELDQANLRVIDTGRRPVDRPPSHRSAELFGAAHKFIARRAPRGAAATAGDGNDHRELHPRPGRH